MGFRWRVSGPDESPQIASEELTALESGAETTLSMSPLVNRRLARMRGRGWLVALVVVAVVGAVGGWLASRAIESPREVAARAQAPAATIITATVQSTTIENTVISRGQIGAVDTVQVGYGVLIPPGNSGSTSSPGGASADTAGASAGGAEATS